MITMYLLFEARAARRAIALLVGVFWVLFQVERVAGPEPFYFLALVALFAALARVALGQPEPLPEHC